MANQRLQREHELFNACLELTLAERSLHLKRACNGDSNFQARIERLLAAHQRAENAAMGPLHRISYGRRGRLYRRIPPDQPVG